MIHCSLSVFCLFVVNISEQPRVFGVNAIGQHFDIFYLSVHSEYLGNVFFGDIAR